MASLSLSSRWCSTCTTYCGKELNLLSGSGVKKKPLSLVWFWTCTCYFHFVPPSYTERAAAFRGCWCVPPLSLHVPSRLGRVCAPNLSLAIKMCEIFVCSCVSRNPDVVSFSVCSFQSQCVSCGSFCLWLAGGWVMQGAGAAPSGIAVRARD